MAVPREIAERGGADLLERVAVSMRRQRGMVAAGEGLGFSSEEIEAFFACDDALAQVYQHMQQPALRAAYRGTARERRKFADAEIPAVTQLFTPGWVVEFLVQNTLGRLWREMHPDTRIPMPWLVGGVPIVARPAKRVEQIRVIDPACGAMNFGIVALEMFRRMYEEAGIGGGDVAGQILRDNLFGIDIDPVAIGLARQTLAMKAGVEAESPMNLWCGDALAEGAGQFDVVVTNPPYLSARNLAPERVRWLKKHYPSGARDLYACFIDRALRLLGNGGRAGLLTMHSFMFTGAFAPLRRMILGQAGIETVAHFGPHLFAGGNPGTLQTAGFVLRKETDAVAREGQRIAAFRLNNQRNADEKCASLRQAIDRPHFVLVQRELEAFPRSAWLFHASGWARRAFATMRRLGEGSPPKQGLATTDNARFVRYWWEVAWPAHAARPRVAGQWLPYAKSGGFARWYQAPRHVVDWTDDGRGIKQAIVERYPYLKGKWQWVAKNSAYYGRAGVTYSYLTSGRFSARLLPAGALFDVAGSALFPGDREGMLAILNSSAARELLDLINPTINFQVGDLGQLPVPKNVSDSVRRHVGKAIELRKTLETFDETSPDFVRPVEWRDGPNILREIHRKLADFERQIDTEIDAMYGRCARQIDCVPEPVIDRKELAKRWVGYAVGAVLGRWGDGRADAVGAGSKELRLALCEACGEVAAHQIEEIAGGLDDFLAGPFLRWHEKVYRKRPIYLPKRGAIVAQWSAGCAS